MRPLIDEKQALALKMCMLETQMKRQTVRIVQRHLNGRLAKGGEGRLHNLLVTFVGQATYCRSSSIVVISL